MSCNSDPGSKRCFNSGSSSASKKRREDVEPRDSIPRASENISLSFDKFMNLYIFVRVLGSGAFGVVNLMEHRISGKLCAVKIVKKTNPNADGKIRNEIKLGMHLDSQHICKVHEYHEDDRHFFIIMEYLKGMDLCDFIRKYPTFFIKNHQSFWFVVGCILHGLAYLHSKGIAHIDIKPENVYLLLDNQGNIIGVKLIDLGLSIVVNDTTKCFRGTPTYMAPDFFSPSCKIDCSVDIWSLGITVFAMIKAYLPTEIASRKKDPKRRQDDTYQKIKNLMLNKSFNPFGEETSEDPNTKEMESFTLSCLITDPTNRPTADDLLKKIPAITSQMSP